MEEKFNHINYTASDIQRYHSGQMSAAEMHALEKAAIEDPFLADALEGYTYTTTPSEDLQKIEARLSEKRSRKKVIPFFPRQYAWMKWAAMLLLVAGGGWLIMNLTGTTKENIAYDAKPTTDQRTTMSSPSTDSTTLSESREESARDSQTTTTDVVYNKKTDDGRKQKQAPATGNRSGDESLIENIPAQTGRTEPVIVTTQTPRVKKDSVINESVNPGAPMVRKDMVTSTAPPKNDTVRLNDVVMQKKEGEVMQEVVVSGYGNKRSAFRQEPVLDSLEPAQGWSYFDDYIANNIQRPEKLSTKPSTTAEVQLTFDINQLGEPVNIKVVKSLCKECDEEAIRLLKQGPKWKQKKNSKGRVSIRF